jgi:hypothetical protein
MPPRATLYDEVVEITIEYLGPAAERFVERQIMTHLHKSPEKITRNDLKKLIDWIRIAISLLTDDQTTINQYVRSLRRLTEPKVNGTVL